MPPALPPLPTSIVGSLPQPEWLVDHEKLAGQFPPRVRAREIWRVAPDLLAGAQDDATLLAIRSQEEAGLDIVTDGEIRRESYSNHFATALDGVDASTTPARCSTARAGPSRCRGWSGRWAGRGRSRPTTSGSCGPTPTAP